MNRFRSRFCLGRRGLRFRWGTWALLGLSTLVFGSGLAGCSWIFVKPVAEDHRPGDIPDCTSNRTAPVIDTVLATTNVASAIYVASEHNVANKGAAVALGLSSAVIWLASAIYGYSSTSACDDAKDEAASTPPYVPPKYYPPPPP